MAELHSRPSATPQPATCYLPTCLMPLRHRATSPLRLILAAYILLAVAYSVVNPLFESPDEIWHYEYVCWLAEGNGLPHPDDVGDAPWHQEGSQPPLYYLSAALLTKPIPTDNAAAVIRYNPHAAIGQAEAWGNRNVMAHGPADQWPWRGVALAAHIARFFSIALGALTVFFTYRIGRTIFPARPAIALCAALLVAFNPQFLFLSAAVNNDNLVTMLSAAGLLLAVTALAQRTPQGDQAAPSWQLVALMGGVAGLAMLSKLSGLFTPLLVGAALTIIAWRLRSWRAWLGFAALAGGTACLVAGWYYVRNQILFGDPLALSAMFDILPRRAFPPTTDELLARAQGIWRSYWAVFGWFNVVTADWIYAVFTGLTLAGLAGLLLSGPLARLTRRTRAAVDPWQVALLIGLSAGILLLLWRWAQMRYPQGRLLFPAISANAILLGWGLTNWFPRSRANWAPILPAGLLVPLAIVMPWSTITPVYAPPVPVTRAAIPQQTDVSFGDALNLAGFELGAEEVHPGGALPVTLYWEALRPLEQDYSIFIHLTDENQILQAQRDSWPGKGNAPTRNWSPGVILPDEYRISVPATTPAPARLRVDVGVYDYASGDRLLVNGQDYWTVGYITLTLAVEGDLPHATFVNFQDEIALVGFDFDRRVMQPGETLALTLWWEALSAPAQDYKVFTHLVLPPESVWAQEDDRPQDGNRRTNTWQSGERIEDHYTLTLPPDAPLGVYFVEIGLYDSKTGKRLQVEFSDKGIVLGQVRVTEDE